MKKIIYSILAILVFCALSIGTFFISDHYAQRWQSNKLFKAKLYDVEGKTWSIKSLKDKLGIIYFGYTFCPDACPTALNNLTIALEKIDKNKLQFKPIFISVDPNRDKPEIIKDYLSSFNTIILGLTGTDRDLKSFTFNIGATYSLSREDPEDEDYLVNHTVGFFMINSEGVRLPIPYRNNSEDLGQAIVRIKSILMSNSNFKKFSSIF
ncbi:MAG: hypothetical protein CMM67_08035 [Rhodospirillaceae bacterium]|nr:hypothetical protein [Rhodospirillaceae bacterium]OUT77171.1 MAG: hypothetical protein CBB83_08205 [Rhodospirillaceae bacterium TMED23]|tara:strand:- start:5585 stop:6211 length:627 start_codon:yes stop_codon:yes gene_type:complete